MTLCHGLPCISLNSNVLPGQEYNYVDDWGEQMNDKSTSVVVILDWISEDLRGNFIFFLIVLVFMVILCPKNIFQKGFLVCPIYKYYCIFFPI